MSSPLGPLTLVTDSEGRLRAIYWSEYQERAEAALGRQSCQGEFVLNHGRTGADARHVMTAFFDGEDRLSDIPLVVGGSVFQRSVWAMLMTIRPSESISYAALAARIGNPKAVRAVGTANGANPLPIVIPCHRVIASGGALGGYGGGLGRKRWLLSHEQRWSKDVVREGELFQ